MTKVPEGMIASPFLERKDKWLEENELAFAINDLYPNSKGHLLIIPKRIVLTPFDMTDEEMAACMALLRSQRARLDAELQPDGYNIGWNVHVAGGQSVAHVHLHLIPRYTGDHPTPRGGICRIMIKGEQK